MTSRAVRVGVLALQGGVREHMLLLESMGHEAVPIRRQEHLLGADGARVDALVLPGGESSVLDRLCRQFGLADPLRRLIEEGLPALGTCAGLIYLAAEILNPAPGQEGLGVLPVAVDRNAFGSQAHSAVSEVRSEWGDLRAAFIRAPRISGIRPGAHAAAWLDAPPSPSTGRRAGGDAEQDAAVVGAASGTVIGISFHPELSGETRVHEALVRLAA